MKQLLVLCLLMAIASCTIEKRLYSPGYHIEWKKHRSKTVSIVPPENRIVQQESEVSRSATSGKGRIDSNIREIPSVNAAPTEESPAVAAAENGQSFEKTKRKVLWQPRRTELHRSIVPGKTTGSVLWWINLVVLIFVTVLACVGIVYLLFEGGWLLALLLLVVLTSLLIWQWPFR